MCELAPEGAGGRSGLDELNTTRRPSALMRGWNAPADDGVPAVARSTRRVVRAARSRTKIWLLPSLTPGTRLPAADEKTTRLPVPSRPPRVAPASAGVAPSPATLARVV